MAAIWSPHGSRHWERDRVTDHVTRRVATKPIVTSMRAWETPFVEGTSEHSNEGYPLPVAWITFDVSRKNGFGKMWIFCETAKAVRARFLVHLHF